VLNYYLLKKEKALNQIYHLINLTRASFGLAFEFFYLKLLADFLFSCDFFYHAQMKMQRHLPREH